ncbi:MAG: protein phosphatase CheZ [Candidatus Accumulibacter sp.]|jgi:chemotaxis protein CheZ|nr:protein phosphatase CheZ [Accumulibacter sp.]
MNDTTSSGDSADLEALFDSIAKDVVIHAPEGTENSAPSAAAENESTPAKQAQKTGDTGNASTGNSQDIQPSSDPAASGGKSAQGAGGTNAGAEAEWSVQNKVFTQVGQMARQLHNTLGALGYDRFLEETVSAIPDARDRLKYIANLTEQAACKVLNATDVANPLQEELEVDAAALAAKWDKLYANQMGVEDFESLASETRAFLKVGIPQRTSATKGQLLEIMMAQDFQDLTGQVIKKIVSLAQDIETQLMSILIDTIPGEKHTESVKTLLNGPVINGEGRSDVVVSQQQVDDLLDSLGF